MTTTVKKTMRITAAAVAVAVFFGGIAYWLSLDRSAAPVALASPVKRPLDISQAARSVALASAPLPNPAGLPAAVTLAPARQVEPPLASVGALASDENPTVSVAGSKNVKAGPQSPAAVRATLNAGAVRKAAGAVPLAGGGSTPANAAVAVATLATTTGTAVHLAESATPSAVVLASAGDTSPAGLEVATLSEKKPESHAKNAAIAKVGSGQPEVATRNAEIAKLEMVGQASRLSPVELRPPQTVTADYANTAHIKPPSRPESHAKVELVERASRPFPVELPTQSRDQTPTVPTARLNDVQPEAHAKNAKIAKVGKESGQTGLAAVTATTATAPALDVASLGTARPEHVPTQLAAAAPAALPALSLGEVASQNPVGVGPIPSDLTGSSALPLDILSSEVRDPDVTRAGAIADVTAPAAVSLSVASSPVAASLTALPGATISTNTSGEQSLRVATTITALPSGTKTGAVAVAGVRQAFEISGPALAVLETNQAIIYYMFRKATPLAPKEPVWDADLFPTDPLVSIQSFPGAEPALIEWLKKWKEQIQRGQATTEVEPQSSQRHGEPQKLIADSRVSRQSRTTAEELTALLASTSLTCTQLYEIGHGIKYVEGMTGAAPFYAAAVRKAELELQGHTPGDPLDLPRIHALAYMAVWYPMEDRVYPTLERSFALIRDYTTLEDGLHFRAEILLADSFYELGRVGDRSLTLKAAGIFKNILDKAEAQGWQKVDLASMHWALACALYQANRFAESVEHFQFAASAGGKGYVKWAQQFYVIALARSGKLEEAKRAYSQWLVEDSPSKLAIEYVDRQFAKATKSITVLENHVQPERGTIGTER